MTQKDTTSRRGLALAASGQLRALRERLGLSPTAMAVLMYLSPVTYRNLEGLEFATGPERRVWRNTAQRMTNFFDTAIAQLDLLDGEGIELNELLPIHVAATLLGLPQEALFSLYRSGEIGGLDLGVLGIWLRRDELALVRV